MQSGLIFDIKKYAIHDGPGIRSTVFFKGCPLSCAWCHNPEGLTLESQRMFSQERCLKCEECIRACPQDALALTPDGVVFDQSRCIGCGICAQRCPSEALQFAGRQMSVAEVMQEIEKDILFYDESGGGVTFSGGEPLLQADFLCRVLDACGGLDINRSVDTTGYTDEETLLKVAARTELFLYDLKHMDAARHKKHTGVSNEGILHNLALLSERGARVNVRIPIIPEFNPQICVLSTCKDAQITQIAIN